MFMRAFGIFGIAAFDGIRGRFCVYNYTEIAQEKSSNQALEHSFLCTVAGTLAGARLSAAV